MNKIIFGVFLSLLVSASTYGMGFENGYGYDNGQLFGGPSNEQQVQFLGNDSSELLKRKDNSETGYKNKRCKEYSSESFLVENPNLGAYNEYTLSYPQLFGNENLLNQIAALSHNVNQLIQNVNQLNQIMCEKMRGSGQVSQPMGDINGISPAQQMVGINGGGLAQFMSNTVPAFGQPVQQINTINGESLIQPTLQINTVSRDHIQPMLQVNQQVTEEVHNKVTKKVKWENPFKKNMFSGLPKGYISIFNKVWNKSFYKFKEGVDAQQVATEYVEFANNELKEALREEIVERVEKWFKECAVSLESDLGELTDEKEKKKWEDLFNEDMFSDLSENYINTFKHVWNRYFYKLKENEDPKKVVDRYIGFANEELKNIIRELAKGKIAIWFATLKNLLEVDPDKFKNQPEIFGLDKYKEKDEFFTQRGKDFGNAKWYPRFCYSENTTGPVLDKFIQDCLNEYIIEDLNRCRKGNGYIKDGESVQKGKGYKFVGFEKENGGEYAGVLSENSFEEIKKWLAYNYSNSLYVWLVALKRPRDLEHFKKSWKCYQNKSDESIAKWKFGKFIKMIIKAKEQGEGETGGNAKISTDILEKIQKDEID